MSLLQKDIYGGNYLYLQYRDEDGRNRSLYIGRADAPDIQRKGKTVHAAYQIALIEARLKEWITGSPSPVRQEWLERVRDGKVTEGDRERALILAYAILNRFHEDICQHQKAGEKCLVKRAQDCLRPFV